jgi:hypothetical protein
MPVCGDVHFYRHASFCHLTFLSVLDSKRVCSSKLVSGPVKPGIFVLSRHFEGCVYRIL